MRLSLLLALCALGSQPAWALDITACGATVPPGETGVLQADLLCSGEYAGVTLENEATLDMNGHSIRGPAVKGVICTKRRCAVKSSVPGSEISGTITGIFKFTTGVLTVSDVYVHDLDAPFPGDHGIEAPDSLIELTRVVVQRTGFRGIIARRLIATDVEVSEHVDIGVFVVRRLVATNLTSDENTGFGVTAKHIDANNLVARNNGSGGVEAVTMRILGGTITGNQSPLDLDVWAYRQPRLTNVTCAHSQRVGAPIGDDFDVCAND